MTAMEFWKTKNEIDREKSRKDLKFQKLSRNRLEEILSTHIKTVMIGALSDFEKTFGELWGHGLSEDKLNENEIHVRELWNEVRTSILDRGNNKIKHMRSELSRHDIKWNRYITKFKVGDQDEY
jgi:hypothetical protein